MSEQSFTELVARLEALAAKLSAGAGSNYPILARIASEMEAFEKQGARTESAVAAAVLQSLAQVVARPMHDHPKFIDLIEIHVSALRLVAQGDLRAGPTGGEMLISELHAATRKVFERRSPNRR